MKWSKLKQMIESRFADSVKGRVAIYATRYTSGSHFMARGWITIDRQEIVNFSNPDNMNRFGSIQTWNKEEIDDKERTPGLAAEKGEFSKYDMTDSCWEYINMNINDAIVSGNPIIQAFAILDKRFGKRRLVEVQTHDLHPLPARMLEFRRLCENLPVETMPDK